MTPTNETAATVTKQLPRSAPDKPLVTIEPSKSWVALNLADLWEYRELLYFLMWRDVKVRYKQTLLGAAWAIIQPFVTMLIFTYFFGKLAKIPAEGVPYPIFAYTGLLVWTFFSNAVTGAGSSLVGSSNLITKVYFPRVIIPSAAVGAGLLDFAIAAVLLVGLMAYYGFAVTWALLILPSLLALTTLLALGVGMWMAALNVKYRDVRYALPFLIQVWFFVTPIIYPSSLVPEEWRWLMVLNPLTGIIEGFRASLFGRPFDLQAIGFSAVFSVVMFLYALHTFRRLERSFAELV
ncbi:MAG TPA: ABC transporter permease [Blastocatellia bacterium]|nr:ABC transporter permease [Blastocatellia bacterium]